MRTPSCQRVPAHLSSFLPALSSKNYPGRKWGRRKHTKQINPGKLRIWLQGLAYLGSEHKFDILCCILKIELSISSGENKRKKAKAEETGRPPPRLEHSPPTPITQAQAQDIKIQETYLDGKAADQSPEGIGIPG